MALTLAACIGGGWLVGVILAALEGAGGEVDGNLASLLNGIGQVVAGALGTFLGFSAGAATKDHPPTSPQQSAGGPLPGGRVSEEPRDIPGP